MAGPVSRTGAQVAWVYRLRELVYRRLCGRAYAAGLARSRTYRSGVVVSDGGSTVVTLYGGGVPYRTRLGMPSGA